MEDIRKQVEKYLGTKIEASEWDSAKYYSEQKLKQIIATEGSANKARYEKWYLAQIIAETIRNSRFSRLTFEYAQLMEYKDR